MRISVVIPTYRRPELLARCLDALAGQTLSASDYEVIVADDAASADTLELVTRYAAATDVDVRYVAVAGQRHGPAAARNAGWREARAPLVAFTDDDTIPAPDWLDNGIEGFDNARLQAAWGRVSVPLPSRPTDYQRDAAGLEDAGFVTANCFVRRDVLERVGGFDEDFEVAWREDSDLLFRMLKLDCCVQYLDRALVVHPVRPAKWGVSVAQQRKSSYDALLYKKHPELYSRFLKGGRPWLYYLIVMSLVGVLTGLLTESDLLTTLAGAAWLSLTITFTMRRLAGTTWTPGHVAEMIVTSALIPPLSVYHRARGGVRHRVLFW